MAKSQAKVANYQGVHETRVQINDSARSLWIPPKSGGYGSSASGGELLFLALATCSCNDFYREAARRSISVERVEVAVDGDFERKGCAASNITYRARVKADASTEQVEDLMRHTDTMAEIQNTLRAGVGIELVSCEAI